MSEKQSNQKKQIEQILQIVSELKNSKISMSNLDSSEKKKSIKKKRTQAVGLLFLFLSWFLLTVCVEKHQSNINELQLQRSYLSSIGTKMDIGLNSILNAQKELNIIGPSPSIDTLLFNLKFQYIMDYALTKSSMRRAIIRNNPNFEKGNKNVRENINNEFEDHQNNIHALITPYKFIATDSLYKIARHYMAAHSSELKNQEILADHIWYYNDTEEVHTSRADFYRTSGIILYLIGSILLGVIFILENLTMEKSKN